MAFWILDFGFWISKHLRFWILDFGFWILDFGFWILDFGFWIAKSWRGRHRRGNSYLVCIVVGLAELAQ